MLYQTRDIDVNAAAKLVGDTFDRNDISRSHVMVRMVGQQFRKYRVYHDGSAYIRVGKRATVKLYLDDMSRAVMMDGFTLPSFYE